MYNFMTMMLFFMVLPEDYAKQILQHESIGNQIYQEFVRARL